MFDDVVWLTGILPALAPILDPDQKLLAAAARYFHSTLQRPAYQQCRIGQHRVPINAAFHLAHDRTAGAILLVSTAAVRLVSAGTLKGRSMGDQRCALKGELVAKSAKSRLRPFGRDWNFGGHSADICKLDWRGP